MFGLERQQSIMKIMDEEKSISVNELARRVYASPATVRRDLTEMEKLGLIKRTHGGAVLCERDNTEISFLVREQENVKGKKKIVEAACAIVKSSYSVFLDSSSTSSMLAPLLARFNPITVFTTGIKTAILLSSKTKAKIYLPGGLVNTNSNSVTGTDTNNYLEGVYIDVAFVSCNGIDEMAGITEFSFEQAEIKKTVLQNAGKKVLLCDSSKFCRAATFKIADFSMFDCMITNEAPPVELAQAAKRMGCDIIV